MSSGVAGFFRFWEGKFGHKGLRVSR